jgi:uncharacterized protein YndB with AHSA1/START domain
MARVARAAFVRVGGGCFAVLLLVASSATPATIAIPESLASPACVACAEDVDAIRASVTDGDWQAILRGEVVTSEVDEGGDAADRASVQVTGLIPSPPARVWRVLTDFESRPAWQSHATEVRIARVEGDRVWVDERLSFFLVPIRCRIVNTLDAEHGALAFALDPSEPHDIGGTKGSWLLRPFAGATETLTAYRSWIDTGRHVPAFVRSILLGRELSKIVSGLRTQVQRVSGAR